MDIRKVKGKRLEDFVEHVYSILLNNENLRDVKIEKNHVEIGCSSVKHEFDILYEIKIAGVIHRLGIECKNHNRAITKGMVQEFKGKLDDTNNIQGIFISSLGYQEGAQVLGNHYGIRLMKVTDLPKINELLASTIKVGMLPDKSTNGDPFWVIMENFDAGNTTGAYFEFGGNQIILFLSKKSAERIVSRHQLASYGVYGVVRQHLKAICYMSKVFGYRLLICSKLLREPEEELMAWNYSWDDIRDEFID